MTEEHVFLAALDLPDVVARAAYLNKACRGNAELRRQIDALLDAHFRSGEFLDVPAAEQIGVESSAASTLTVDGDPVSPEQASEESDGLQFLTPSTRLDSLGRLGHYEMLQVLGRGGFGIVFRAFDDMLQRVVAVKVMAPQIAVLSPARRRFLREARASAQVRHENVVNIHEVGEHPLPYLVMEFVPGETLQQKLDRSGPLEVSEVLRIGRQVAEGLAAAHASDLIHRDIKPGNILLEGRSQRVKITDFGLARAADDASISQSGIIAGTPMFMAPEQALGHKLDQRADLFSLGSVLYQMAAGRVPFRANSTVAVLKRVAEDTPRDIREIIPETPQWLCDIIAKLHAKNPDDRFQSAREVADLLADCEAKLKAKQEVTNVLPAAVKPAAPTASGGRKWVAAVAVLLFPVIALAVTEFAGVTHLFRGQQAPPDPTKPGSEPPPVVVEKKEPPVPVPVAKQEPPVAVAPFTDADVQRIAALPAAGQVEEVRKELMRRNSGFDGTVGHKIDGDQVTELRIVTDKVTDISPIRVFNSLRVLDLSGSQVNFKGNGQLADLSPLIGMNLAGLERLNLNFTMVGDEGLVHFKDCMKLTSLALDTTQVSDTGLAFFKDCTDLTYLNLNRLKISDAGLAHFKNCKNLKFLHLGGSPVGDAGLSYFKECEHLTLLGLSKTRVTDAGLAHFKDCKKLANLALMATPVTDAGLAHFKDSKELTRLHIGYTKVTDLSLIKGMPLKELDCSFRPERDAEILRSIKTLEKINGKPAAEFWEEVDQKQALEEGWPKSVAALPAAEQIEEVRKELMRRNPGFDGIVEHKIQDGVVTEFKVVTEQVTDIAPLRVFNALRVLDCGGTPGTQGTPARKSQLADLTPLKGMNLTQLTTLHLRVTKVGDADMALFKDCKNLRHLFLYATPVSDAGLAHFNGCKGLVTLDLTHTRVTDAGLAGFRECAGLEVLYLSATNTGDAGLTHFKDCKNLRFLFIGATNATHTGLAHFKDCKKLGRLSIAGSKVTDLSVLKEMPLTELSFDFKPERDVEVLRSIKTLETINGKPVAQFWKDAEARQAEFKEWLQLVPTLPAEQQVAAVAARLKERNPGLDGTARHKIEGGVVTELIFTPVKGQDVVTDLSPVRALVGLTYLNLWGCVGLEDLEPLKGMKLTRLIIGSFHVSTQVRDLEPLRGMKLTELSLYNCQVQDLEPLKDMPLTRLVLLSRQVRSCEPLKGMPLNVLNLGYCPQIQDFTPLQGLPLTGLHLNDCKVRDLGPFKGMKLTGLGLAGTPVRDLELLKGMPLKTLSIQNTGVTDLRPLQGMELEEIRLTPKDITQGLDILRDMKSLKKMGIEYNPSWEPKEFWERYDKGEFKK